MKLYVSMVFSFTFFSDCNFYIEVSSVFLLFQIKHRVMFVIYLYIIYV